MAKEELIEMNGRVAEILPENEGMRRVCSKLGFKQQVIPGTRSIFAEISLDDYTPVEQEAPLAEAEPEPEPE